MQRKDDKVGNNTGHMKKDKGKKECREKRPNRFTKKSKFKSWLMYTEAALPISRKICTECHKSPCYLTKN